MHGLHETGQRGLFSCQTFIGSVASAARSRVGRMIFRRFTRIRVQYYVLFVISFTQGLHAAPLRECAAAYRAAWHRGFSCRAHHRLVHVIVSTTVQTRAPILLAPLYSLYTRDICARSLLCSGPKQIGFFRNFSSQTQAQRPRCRPKLELFSTPRRRLCIRVCIHVGLESAGRLLVTSLYELGYSAM